MNKKNQLIKMVKEDKNLEPYFFEKLIEKKDPEWFYLLKDNGFMKIDKIQKVKDNEYIEKWYVLEYIKSIMEIVCESNNNEILDDVKSLLNNISNESNNYKVFQQSLDLIYLMPSNTYDKEYLRKILNNWNEKSNIDIMLNIGDLFQKLVDKNDLDKSIVVLEISLENMLSRKDNTGYFKFKIDKHINILCKHKCVEMLNILIKVMEKYLIKSNYSRKINDDIIKINRTEKNYEIYINNKKLFETRFYKRDKDINEIKENLKNIYDEETSERISKLIYGGLFSKENLKSVYENYDLYASNAIEYIIYLTKKVLEESYNNEQIEKLIIEMIKNEYDLIIKLGLYGLNCIVHDNNKQFDNILKENIYEFDYIIRFYIFDEDIKYIFENLKSINDDSIHIIDVIINRQEYINHGFGDEFNNIWKQKRYKSLSNIKYFEEILLEIKEITKCDIELRPPISIGNFYKIEQKSLISCNDIKNMSNEELVDEMEKFKPIISEKSDKEKISYEGFGAEIKKAIIEEPERFYSNLKLFNNIQNEFMAFIIDAFNELINNKQIDEVTNIIELFYKYIHRADFWKELESDRCSYEVILKRIFNFLSDYLNDDKIKFDNICYQYIINILYICIDKIEYKKYEKEVENNNDYRDYLLNNLIALNNLVLLSLVLRLKRNTCSIKNKEIYNIYQAMKVKCPKSLYLSMGYYIQQLTFIDKEWVKRIINMDRNEENKDYFMIGYLINYNINKEYFEMMIQDYNEFIEKEYKDKFIKTALINHIVVGYINKFNQSSQLIDKLISKSNEETIINIINICMKLDERSVVVDTDYDSKILYIWTEIIEKAKFLNNKSFIKIIKESTEFITKFNKLNKKIKENIMISFLYMDDDFYTGNLVTYLNDFINKLDKNDINTIDILDEVIKDFVCKVSPIYPEKEIKELIEYILEKNPDNIMDILEAYTKKNKAFTVVGKFIRQKVKS